MPMLKKPVPIVHGPHHVFRVVSGNVIGVVEKPETIDPRKPVTEQYLVKIGALDTNDDFSKADAVIVINKLRDFCETLK